MKVNRSCCLYTWTFCVVAFLAAAGCQPDIPVLLDGGTEPICGDGTIDPGEECDDGNISDGDGCQSMCVLPSCGDGIEDPGGDGCSVDC